MPVAAGRRQPAPVVGRPWKASKMTIQILLALAAGMFTASASVAQRVAAAPAPGELRFRWRLVVFLMRRPVWFLGIVFMICGFVFQVAALHFGDLSLVQPVIASELLFVFGYLAVRYRGRIRAWDWVAAGGMAVSLGGFLYLADPGGGSTTHPTTQDWALAALAVAVTAGVAAAFSAVQFPGRRAPTPARRAALLAVSAGISWGFVAAVVKELAGVVTDGPYAVLTTWSPYALVGAGAVAMFIVSNAFQAGPLAASQPGLTIVEPLVASLLGVTLFGEHVRDGTAQLTGEAVLLVVLVASVVLLSRSPLIAIGPERRGTRTGGSKGAVRAGEPPGEPPGGPADEARRAAGGGSRVGCPGLPMGR